MGRHETTFEQRLRMDEYTISNWSLWMDFYILMKTASVDEDFVVTTLVVCLKRRLKSSLQAQICIY